MAERTARTVRLEALEAELLAKRVRELEGALEHERATQRRATSERERERESLLALFVGALERRDADTGGHCRRVTSLASRICRAIGHTPDEDTVWGFMLHDIGKIWVPDAILHKPGPLTPEEWVVMRRHPEEGAYLLRPTGLLERAVPIVLHHHERWDGSGYPMGLCGDEIPLAARAFAIADAFDALTENRPYRRGRKIADAIDVIAAGRGTQFAPDCVDAFLATVARPDYGSLSQLRLTDSA